jgi:hypothetical protein
MSKKMIQIDGCDVEVLRTEMKEGSFGIETPKGMFWMQPVRPKSGRSFFWMREDGVGVELPLECPVSIRRVTFDEPDLTDQFPEEVAAAYEAHLAHCKKSGLEEISLASYKAGIAVFEMWNRHESPELVVQYGYLNDDFMVYHNGLERQGVDPGCLYQFKWAAEYEVGDLILFGALDGVKA